VLAGIISFAALLLMVRLLAPVDESPGAEERREAPDNLTGGPALISELPENLVPGEEPLAPESTEEIFPSLGVGVSTADPRALVEQIAQVLEAGKPKAAANLIGRKALSGNQLQRLQELPRLTLNKDRPVSEIGELELNRRARWALNPKDANRPRIYLDLLRDEGEWGVQKVILPGEAGGRGGVLDDALGIADAFLQAALKQRFENARAFVAPGKVSDARIAGLCIVFEEGIYRLRERKPLRVALNRDGVAAFLVNVETRDGAQAAQFGLTLKRDAPDSPWRIVEINLDQLLAGYADQLAGGDSHYTPLIRNPNGGDTLILYFEFDDDLLSPRTQRQLEIVSLLLQTDQKKNISLSGHTDAIGSEKYNQTLSGRRAEAVRRFLIGSGVSPGQIHTVALGKTRPRRPNTVDGGADNPEGRRANRRTEIYLDF